MSSDLPPKTAPDSIVLLEDPDTAPGEVPLEVPLEVPVGHVRLLPTDPRDMIPSAVRWARTVHATIRTIPRAQLPAPSRTSLQAVVWVLAAATDYDDRIPADHTAALLAQEASVGVRVWQKRTAWLRERGWLVHGPGGQSDGWQLSRP